MEELQYPRCIWSPDNKIKGVQTSEEAQPYYDKGYTPYVNRIVETLEEEESVVELEEKIKENNEQLKKLRGRPRKV